MNKFSIVLGCLLLSVSHVAQACQATPAEKKRQEAIKAEDISQKLVLYKKSIELCSTSPLSYAEYGYLLSTQGRLNEAELALRQSENLISNLNQGMEQQYLFEKYIWQQLVDIAIQKNDRIQSYLYLEKLKAREKQNKIEFDESYFSSQQAFDELMNIKPMTAPEFRSIMSFKAAGIDEGVSIDYNINFDFNDAKLTQEGEQLLSQIANTIKELDSYATKIKIIGHTDIVGDEQYNKTLSIKRASTVKSALSKMLPKLAKRLIVEGKGKDQPKYPSTHPDADRLNRRVQFEIL